MISAVTIAGTNSDDPRGHNEGESRGCECDEIKRDEKREISGVYS
jgi:hypothetical protein